MRSTLLLFFWILFSTALWAQKSDTLAYSIDIADVVVTGFAKPLSAAKALHEVRILTQADLRSRGFTRLSEVLEREVSMGVSQDPILGAGLNIQGLGGQNVQVLIDGMPVTGRLGGNVDLSQIDLSEIVKIEIISGSMAVQYGSNAAGGIVNLITRKEQDETFEVKAEGQTESSGVRYASVGLGFRQNKWSIGAGANVYSTNFGDEEVLRERQVDTLNDGSTLTSSVIPWNPKEQLGWRGNLGYRLTENFRLEYRVRGFEETLTLYGELRRPQYKPYVVDQVFTTQRTDHQLLAQGKLSEKWYVKATAGYNQFDRFKATVRTDIEPDTTGNVLGGADTTRYTSKLARVSTSFAHSRKLDFQFGLEYLNETAAGGRILDTASLSVEPGISSLAFWAGVNYKPIKKLEVAFTSRLGYNAEYRHPIVPAFHIRYGLDKHWTLRASYARGFRAPSVQELHFNFIDINHYIIGNTCLSAESSGNASLSATFSNEWESNGNIHDVELSLRAYHNTITDRITLFEFSSAQYTYGNLNSFRTQGAIASASYSIGKRWSAQASVGVLQQGAGLDTELEFDELTTSVEANLLLQYNIPKVEIDICLDHRFYGHQTYFILDRNGEPVQQTLGAYHLVNFTLQRAFWNNQLILTAGLKDLLDIDTVTIRGSQSSGSAHTGSSSSRLIGFGRTAFVGLSLNF